MISSSIRALNTNGLTSQQLVSRKLLLVSLIEVSLLAGGYVGRPLDITVRCARRRELRADSKNHLLKLTDHLVVHPGPCQGALLAVNIGGRLR